MPSVLKWKLLPSPCRFVLPHDLHEFGSYIYQFSSNFIHCDEDLFVVPGILVLDFSIFVITAMRTLQGLALSPTVCIRKHRVYAHFPVNWSAFRNELNPSGFCVTNGRINLNTVSWKSARSCLNLSSGGNGNTDENSENESDYIDSAVIEAVEVKSGADGFMIRMRDGKYLRCVHNRPQGGRLPDYAPHPAIVLKMEDGTGLLLPIIVLETPSVLLMAALRNVPIARPTMYQVVGEMVNKMGYRVNLVRITKRVQESYFAELYLSKVTDMTKCLTFDLRPSDAINIAVRCKVPIQVNKHLAYNDGMRIIDTEKLLKAGITLDDLPDELDRPCAEGCVEAAEFDLVRNMLIAAVEERYHDAARYRDKLTELRSKRNWP